MDTISMLGVRATPTLNRHFSGSFSQDQTSTEAAKGNFFPLEIACNIRYLIFEEITNTYNILWLNYESPAITGRSSLYEITGVLHSMLRGLGSMGTVRGQ